MPKIIYLTLIMLPLILWRSRASDFSRGLELRITLASPRASLSITNYVDGTLSLSQSELVHFLRHKADLLFESVAATYKNRAIALVLTGTGSDGAMGVKAIKKMGGMIIVQDVKTAEFSGMPSAAIQTGNVDFILRLDEISSALVTLVMGES
ncbi:hypothetical protein LC653_36065 [Nostoc sp. CHAB 5784]|uniref:chemotaxis protein CheB n=1 Tax=Nostoc mirabile TaxID=2907820 RepID=UPI001E4BA280|nr:chemotaxis protein CheB [Nostoc mirabile]MCC5669131.1 hypothetical protein [Nostoc mirabile CHAB5784]